MVTIDVRGMRATVQDGEWKSEDDLLQRMLRTHFTPKSLKGYHPDLDIALAEAAVERLGATIVERDEPEHEPGRTY